ncbi:cytochrome c3 family protein [Roseicella frigidaeris]|nr:cytochrome c3 family protein [Roseicella frigidaeris]
MLYLVLGILGAAIAVGVPMVVYRSGSEALPLWRDAVDPGPLSAAHAFLEGRCGDCHTPNRGVQPVACLTCHATDMPTLARQSTAFHASIGECSGCHAEHVGVDRRPTIMDHAVLASVGASRAAASSHRTVAETRVDAAMARLRSILDEAAADLGASPTPRPLPKEAQAALDCNGCHSNRDPHRTLFGRDCQDCHDVLAWRVAGYRHPSPTSQDCAQCHRAPPSHYMMHFEMVSQMVAGQHHARVEQCYLCHQTDAWNDIRGVGWYKHH